MSMWTDHLSYVALAVVICGCGTRTELVQHLEAEVYYPAIALGIEDRLHAFVGIPFSELSEIQNNARVRVFFESGPSGLRLVQVVPLNAGTGSGRKGLLAIDGSLMGRSQERRLGYFVPEFMPLKSRDPEFKFQPSVRKIVTISVKQRDGNISAAQVVLTRREAGEPLRVK